MKCHFCNKESEGIRLMLKQAYGCASEVHKEGIICRYGSSYDLSMFEWTKKSGIIPRNDQILVCDECIAKWIDKGWIREICENYWIQT